MCCSAQSMPRHHLHKCALLGKGREDLLQCGTAYGHIPAGLTVIDAAGTPVEGQARPGDSLYMQQYAAFNAAVRAGSVWGKELPDLLEWLQQFRQQVGMGPGLVNGAVWACAQLVFGFGRCHHGSAGMAAAVQAAGGLRVGTFVDWGWHISSAVVCTCTRACIGL
jgi:hypothetical protein